MLCAFLSTLNFGGRGRSWRYDPIFSDGRLCYKHLYGLSILKPLWYFVSFGGDARIVSEHYYNNILWIDIHIYIYIYIILLALITLYRASLGQTRDGILESGCAKCIKVYIYIYIYTHIYIHTYDLCVYIYIEREREGDIYIYIYIYSIAAQNQAAMFSCIVVCVCICNTCVYIYI